MVSASVHEQRPLTSCHVLDWGERRRQQRRAERQHRQRQVVDPVRRGDSRVGETEFATRGAVPQLETPRQNQVTSIIDRAASKHPTPHPGPSRVERWQCTGERARRGSRARRPALRSAPSYLQVADQTSPVLVHRNIQRLLRGVDRRLLCPRFVGQDRSAARLSSTSWNAVSTDWRYSATAWS